MYGDMEFSRPVVLEPPDEYESWGAQKQLNFGLDGATSRIRFREFFRNFRLDGIHIYREALIRHWNRNEMFIEVDLAHLNEFDEVLFNNLQVFGRFPLFSLADGSHSHRCCSLLPHTVEAERNTALFRSGRQRCLKTESDDTESRTIAVESGRLPDHFKK